MMSHGIALTDADRQPWLDAVRQSVERFLSAGANAVIACSALKESYRRRIVVDPSRVKVVYLKGPQELVASRLRDRRGHFMRPELLQSQFDALEEPRDAIVADISASPGAIVASIRAQLGSDAWMRTNYPHPPSRCSGDLFLRQAQDRLLVRERCRSTRRLYRQIVVGRKASIGPCVSLAIANLNPSP